MKLVKILIVFVLGLTLGALGGGYFGYHVGAVNPAIKRAPSAGIVAVQQEHTPTNKETPVPASQGEVTETPPVTSGTPVQNMQNKVPETEKLEEYTISPNDNSQIMWVGYKTVLGQELSMEGGFANFEGKITTDGKNPDKSLVEVIVDMKSLFSSNTILTSVLKTETFFKVSDFPQARFVSTKIEPAPNGYIVTGNFTLKGATVGIQFPAVIEKRAGGVYTSAEFKLDRKLWDVGYDSYEDSIILKDVVISFEILAEPKK
jgi:polyisoprenoid-binding protein YceI